MIVATPECGVDEKHVERRARLARTITEIRRDGYVVTRSGKRVSTSPTGLDERSAGALRRLFVECGAVRTIETGFALGLSTLTIVETALEVCSARAGSPCHCPEGGPSHTVIDPYQAKEWGNAGLVTAERAGIGDLVRFFAADSLLKLPELCAAGERFDAAFVDGGHLFEHVLMDTYFLLRMVKPGGVIVVDDWWMPAVKAGVDYVVKNLGVSYEERKDVDGAERFAVLRVPERWRERGWDDFVEFGAGWGR